MEFLSGLFRGKTPLHGCPNRIPDLCPGLHLPAYAVQIRQTAVQALTSQHGTRDLHPVQPRTRLGRRVRRQLLRQLPRFLWQKV